MGREVTEFVTPADLDAIPDGSTYKKMSATEQTKLGGIEEGADVNPADLAALDSAQDTKLNGIDSGAEVNPTGLEMQTAIVGLADGDRKLIGSEPQSGEFKIYGLHKNAAGNLEADNEDTAES